MTGVEILQAILEILFGGITTTATSMGAGLSGMVTSVFLTGTGESQTLSTFAVVIIAFAGISLCLGLFRWVLNKITSFGGSRN